MDTFLNSTTLYPKTKFGGFLSGWEYKYGDEKSTTNTHQCNKRSSSSAVRSPFDMEINPSISADEAKKYKLNNLPSRFQESSIYCPNRQIAIAICNKIFNQIPTEYIDPNGNACYCSECHQKRGDDMIYYRGNPPKKYTLPVGWVRLGLKTNEGHCAMNNVWKEWHVAYHGTSKEAVPQIFQSRLTLIKPNDITYDGDAVHIRSGHIKHPFKRKNNYTQKDELFDPNQIYCSPSIKYAGNRRYAERFVVDHPFKRGTKMSVRLAFQMRIKPGAYCIGQETIGAAEKGVTFDKDFSNDELEWYTKQSVGIVLYGLLFRVKEIKHRTLPPRIFIYGGLADHKYYYDGLSSKLRAKVKSGRLYGYKMPAHHHVPDPYAIKSNHKNDYITGKILIFDDHDKNFKNKLQIMDELQGYDPDAQSLCHRDVVIAHTSPKSPLRVIVYYQEMHMTK